MQRSSEKSAARPRVVIAASEHTQLLNLAEKAFERDSPVGKYLVDELSRALVVPDGTCGANIVRIGSRVTYREDATSRIRKVTLTYPKDADIDSHRISILTPIGAALIGLSPAQTIQWPSPSGAMQSLTVLDVENEPSTTF